MLQATLRLVQVMDSWAISCVLHEDHDDPSLDDYSHSGTVLPLTEEEVLADPLTAILSAIRRWVQMTTVGGPDRALVPQDPIQKD